jgi:hypothetical protein
LTTRQRFDLVETGRSSSNAVARRATDDTESRIAQ